jgi:hypothetical protein
MTDTQLELLDKFEGGYSQQTLQITIPPSSSPTPAIAYIAKDPRYLVPPTEQYLTAIHAHLREHHPVQSIPVLGFDPSLSPASLPEKFVFVPPAPQELTLESLCVEVNTRRATPWEMPRRIRLFVAELGELGVHTTAELSGATIVPRADTSLDEESVAILKELLKSN